MEKLAAKITDENVILEDVAMGRVNARTLDRYVWSSLYNLVKQKMVVLEGADFRITRLGKLRVGLD